MWSLQISVNLSRAKSDLLHQTTNFDKFVNMETTNFDKFVVIEAFKKVVYYIKRQISINLSWLGRYRELPITANDKFR
jgi:hypothetical protein